MATHTDREAHKLPDGSSVEVDVRTSDAAAFHAFTAEVTRRVERASRSVGRAASQVPSRGATRTSGLGRTDTRQSTTTHALPGGEATVSIDASDPASHERVRLLVASAAAHARAVHVEAGRAALLAALLLGGAAALAAFVHPFLAVPLLGAGGVVALHLVVYLLSARGVAVPLSRVPEPVERGFGR